MVEDTRPQDDPSPDPTPQPAASAPPAPKAPAHGHTSRIGALARSPRLPRGRARGDTAMMTLRQTAQRSAFVVLLVLACSAGCTFHLGPDRKPPTCPPRYTTLPSNIVLWNGTQAEVQAMNGYTPTSTRDEAEISLVNRQTNEEYPVFRVELTTWNESVGKLEVLGEHLLRYTNGYSCEVDFSSLDHRVEQTADGHLCISNESFSFVPEGDGSIDHSAFFKDELKNTGPAPLAVRVTWFRTKLDDLFHLFIVRDESEPGVSWEVDLQPGGDLLVSWAMSYTLQRARARYTDLEVTADDFPLWVLRKSEYDALNPMPAQTNFVVFEGGGSVTLHRFVGSPTINSLSQEVRVSVVEGR